MEIGLKKRRPIRPPANDTWAVAASDGNFVMKWPVTFKTRDAFEGFMDALKEITGEPADIQLSTPPRTAYHVEQPATLHSVDELFRHTEQPVYQLVFRMRIGHIGINNNNSECIVAGNALPAGAAVPHGASADAGTNAIILTKVLARYATAKWARPRFRKVKAVTRVPETEARNRVWELSVGGASVFLGGLAGVIGGIFTSTNGGGQ